MKKIIDRLTIWAALHIDSLPYFASLYIGRRFDIERLIAKTDDPFPRRLLFKRLYRPQIRREDGAYLYGRMPLTVGQRFKCIQALQRGDTAGALRVFYSIPRRYLMLGRFDKINKMTCHMMRDLEAREARDRRLQTPLTEIQKQAGYGKLNAGLFGVIDYIAKRNGLTYHEVEGLSDATLYAVLKIDHDTEAVRRREMEIMQKKSKQAIKTRRPR